MICPRCLHAIHDGQPVARVQAVDYHADCLAPATPHPCYDCGRTACVCLT